jgi:hypothetical protein
MTVRTAALVLAYRYPIGLSALTRYFDLTGTDMFVHVDAKIDETPFREAAAAATREVTFLPDRVAVFWRGFTVVEATIALLKAARANDYDRYLLISDDSLPLVAPAEFRARLAPEMDYMAARPADDELRIRYDRFYMFDSAVTQARWLALSDRHVDAETVDRFARLGRLVKRGKKPLETCYHASQWMALTRQSVDTILKSWKSDVWLRESFEFSEVPDEQYFPTILCLKGRPESRHFMHVDWSGDEPPHVFTTLKEVAALEHTGPLFVRKIDFGPRRLDAWFKWVTRARPSSRYSHPGNCRAAHG